MPWSVSEKFSELVHILTFLPGSFEMRWNLQATASFFSYAVTSDQLPYVYSELTRMEENTDEVETGD